MQTIAERIKAGLCARKMKQSDLVEATKIGKSSISTYISGAYEPKQKNIYKIAKALDVSEAWLMGYDVPMDREKPAPTSEDGPSQIITQIMEVVRRLPPETQQKCLEYFESLLALQNSVHGSDSQDQAGKVQ